MVGPVVTTAVRDAIGQLGPWFHNVHLPDGTQTAPDHPLGDFPRTKWRRIAPHIPDDLSGWRVLDIGCNAGFYSVEFAKRGAVVTAIDIDPHYLAQAAWCAEQFGVASQISLQRASVYALAHDTRRWDLVWFLGVLYHLRHPLLALDLLRQVTTQMLVVQTMTMPGDEVLEPPHSMGLEDRDWMRRPGWPVMAFIPGTLAADPTNWWAPNHACVLAMLRAAGFRVRDTPAHEFYVCEPDPDEDVWTAGMRALELRAATGQQG